MALLVVRVNTPPPEPPNYRQLTFGREFISSARFAPDQRTIVYSSAHIGMQTELFSLAPDSHAPVSLGLKDADLESISSGGEMLLIQQRRDLVRNVKVGLLARAPLSGAAPRPMMSDVGDADWGPDNQIAVAHYVDGHFRIEYPIGHVLYDPATGWLTNVRVSPKGGWVAFAEHPTLGRQRGPCGDGGLFRPQAHSVPAAVGHCKRSIGLPPARKCGSPARKKARSFSFGLPIFRAIPAWSTEFRPPQPSTILPAMGAFFLGKISFESWPTHADLVRIKNTM